MTRTLASLTCTLFLGGTLLLLAGCSSHDDGDGTPVPDDSSKTRPLSEAPPIEPPPGPDDVVGIVRDYRTGPVGGATLSSGNTVTTTDAWGRFVLRNAPSEYDLICVLSGRAAVIHGLTTRKPTVQCPDNGGWVNNAPIHIDYSDAISIGSERITFAVRDDVGTEEIFYGRTGPNTLDANTTWAGPIPELTGRFLSLEYEAPRLGAPTNYLGIAFSPMRILPGQQATFHPIYSPITTTTTVTGIARPAPGTTLYETYLLLGFGGVYSPVNRSYALRTTPAQFVVPEVPGASWAIKYSAYETGSPGSSGGAYSGGIVPIAADGSVPDIDLATPPKIVLPADGATDFDVGSEIAWQGDGTCTVTVSSAPDYRVELTTRESHITMPDLSAVGISFRHGAKHDLFLWCHRRPYRAPDADPVLDVVNYYAGEYLGTSGYGRLTAVTSR